MDNFFLTLFALLLVALNGYFVAAEFALVKLRLTRAEQLARQRGPMGRLLYKVRQDLDIYLSACQLGITLASLGLGWVGEPAFARLIEPLLARLGLVNPATVSAVSFTSAFLVISFLHIVLGELAPKSAAIRKAEEISYWTATPLYAFYWVMYPFIWVLNTSANVILRLFGLNPGRESEESHSPEEIRSILLASQNISDDEDESQNSKAAAQALELSEIEVGDLMQPISKLITLELGNGLAENLAVMTRTRFSRYPVTDGGRDNIIGLLHVRDLLGAMQRQLLAESGLAPPVTPPPGGPGVRPTVVGLPPSRPQMGASQFPSIPGRPAITPPAAGAGAGSVAGPEQAMPGLDLKALLREMPITHRDVSADTMLQRFRAGLPHLALVVEETGTPVGFITFEGVLESVFGPIEDEFRRQRDDWEEVAPGVYEGKGWLSILSLERLLDVEMDEDEVEEVDTVGGLVMQELNRMAVSGDMVSFKHFTVEVLETRGARIERVLVRVRDPNHDGEHEPGDSDAGGNTGGRHEAS